MESNNWEERIRAKYEGSNRNLSPSDTLSTKFMDSLIADFSQELDKAKEEGRQEASQEIFKSLEGKFEVAPNRDFFHRNEEIKQAKQEERARIISLIEIVIKQVRQMNDDSEIDEDKSPNWRGAEAATQAIEKKLKKLI